MLDDLAAGVVRDLPGGDLVVLVGQALPVLLARPGAGAVDRHGHAPAVVVVALQARSVPRERCFQRRVDGASCRADDAEPTSGPVGARAQQTSPCEGPAYRPTRLVRGQVVGDSGVVQDLAGLSEARSLLLTVLRVLLGCSLRLRLQPAAL